MDFSNLNVLPDELGNSTLELKGDGGNILTVKLKQGNTELKYLLFNTFNLDGIQSIQVRRMPGSFSYSDAQQRIDSLQ